MHFETLAVHAGATADPSTGAVTPAIQLSTTFERAADGSFPSGYTYIRDANPNRRALESAKTRAEVSLTRIAQALPSPSPSPSVPIMSSLTRQSPGPYAIVPDFKPCARQHVAGSSRLF